MTKNCILCGEPLDKYPTNREHYVPQVLIREFKKLCIPQKYDWAVRINEHSFAHEEEHISVPLSSHKQWAVIEVHEKCNLEASGMCQDLRYIIDHIDDEIDVKYFQRPLEYYSKIWHLNIEDVSFTIYNEKDARRWLKSDTLLLYRPGMLDCGRINILAKKPFRDNLERHTIYIGTREALNEV